MTPSEKKDDPILESMMRSAADYAGCGCCSDISTEEFIARAKLALSEAERRGFERAKELMLEELKTRDFIGPLTVRNLKYEEA